MLEAKIHCDETVNNHDNFDTFSLSGIDLVWYDYLIILLHKKSTDFLRRK